MLYFDGRTSPSDRPEDSTAANAAMTLELEAALARRLRQAALSRGRRPEELAAVLLARGLDQAARQTLAAEALQSLTPRQQQVAWRIARGYTNHQIAHELVVSPETVKTHVRNVLEKFEAHSKAELRVLLVDLGVRWWQTDPDPRPSKPPRRPD